MVVGVAGGFLARASIGNVSTVTEPNGGTVVLAGGTWEVYAPSNHSSTTNGSATVFTTNGNWVSVGGDTPLPSGTTHTTIPWNSGNTLIVCPPGSANSNASGC